VEHRRIGELDVSVVGLGCNNFGTRSSAEQAREVVDAALDAGVNYFDTAESYGAGQSEEFLGAALAGRRDGLVIATKWGSTGSHAAGTRSAVRAALEGSLRRLGTDHVDHYQLHRPDPDTPVEETLEALNELVAEGKVRVAGCSNFSAVQLDESADAAATLGTEGFASVQNHYSLLTRDPERDGVLDACVRHGIAMVPFFPLESGVLTGKYRLHEALPDDSRLAAWGERASRFVNDQRLEQVAALSAWAHGRGHTMLDLAMSWLTTNPSVATVIAGATRPDQVRDNVSAASWALTDEDRTEIDALLAT
jgi:aryl-alcohol dehydrogenase-like predicted oxidoreductase